MKRILALALLLASACKPSNGESLLVDETADIPPGKFVFFGLYTDHDCLYEFSVSPAGGGVEAWAASGPAMTLTVIDVQPAGDHTPVAAGTTGVVTGSFAIGKINANVLNRGSANVKVKCRLVTRIPKKS